jgi:hypothetical protein
MRKGPGCGARASCIPQGERHNAGWDTPNQAGERREVPKTETETCPETEPPAVPTCVDKRVDVPEFGWLLAPSNYATTGAVSVQEDVMAKKTARGRRQDRARVAGKQGHEVSYEAKKTGKSKAKVKRAVKRSGPSRKKVERALNR